MKPTGGHFGAGEGGRRFLLFFPTTFFFATGFLLDVAFLVSVAFFVAVALGVGAGDLVAPAAEGARKAATTTSAIKRLISVPLKFTDREEDSDDEPDK